jgi:hypothetical protein
MSIYQDWLAYNRAFVHLEQIRVLINNLPGDIELKVSEQEEMDLFTLTTVANRLTGAFKERAIEASEAITKENVNEYH